MKEGFMFDFNDINEKLNQEKLLKIKDIVKWLLSTYYKSTGIKVIFIDRKGKLFYPLLLIIFFVIFAD